MEKCVRCGEEKERYDLNEHDRKLYCRICHYLIHEKKKGGENMKKQKITFERETELNQEEKERITKTLKVDKLENVEFSLNE